MRESFFQILHDETLRTELGQAVVADLAVENLQLSTLATSMAVRRTIIEHTAASYVLADSSKLGVIAVHRVCPLDRVTAVLTDDEGEPGAHEAFTSAGVTVLRASGPRHRPLTEVLAVNFAIHSLPAPIVRLTNSARTKRT